MPVRCDARDYDSAKDLRASYRATSARLNALRPPAGAAAQSQQVSAPASHPSARPVHPAAPASIPGVADIVAAVAAEIGVGCDQLMSDISSNRAGEGRKIAAALAASRLALAPGRVAAHFGVVEETVRTALARIAPTLIDHAVPKSADLAATVRLVVADWEFIAELRPSVLDIKRAVCAAYGVSRAELESNVRTACLVGPRHAAMALAKRLTGRSLPYIGKNFGGRDHTTALHAVKKMRPVIEAAAASLPPRASVEQWVRAVRLASKPDDRAEEADR
jgi:hypothetical protein